MTSPSPDATFVKFQWKTYSDAALARLVLDKGFPINLFEEVLSVVVDPGFKPHDVTFKHAHCIFDQVAAFGKNLAVKHGMSAPSDSVSVRVQTDGHSNAENSEKSAFTAPQPSNSGSFEGTPPVFVGAGASGQTTGLNSALDQSDDQTGAFAARNTLTDPTTNAHDKSVSPVVMGSANPLSSVFSGKDANAPSAKQSSNTISPYCETSFKEARRQDYTQGREPTGGVGQTKAFGLAPSPSTNAASDQSAARFGGLFLPKNQQLFGNIYQGQTTTASYGSVPPVTTGSSNPPYSVFSEKDVNEPKCTLHYQSISIMPSYHGTSFEELRLQDYTQGRKPTKGISQSKTFQLAPSQSTFAPFGKITASANTPGVLSQNGQRTSSKPSTSFGLFGRPVANHGPAQATGTGVVVSGLFGQNAQQQQTKNTGPTNRSGGRGQRNQSNSFDKPSLQSGLVTPGTGSSLGEDVNQPVQQSCCDPLNWSTDRNQCGSLFCSNRENLLKAMFEQLAIQPTSAKLGQFGQNNQLQQQDHLQNRTPNQQQ
ncbi:uncharacterized protein FOMMEDRAFT_139681 [Fomitiporia mediterranea MF3/22]|uniref:uncharacterized protein n=1 Tax=Fomitiporia mediterranea (strain MF3/22) TaxID=694068 RepID=UPI0004407C5A|nr:uncharacterized protein FOMMEDRAFT_139681 [Fomitiporia mediterranea MF3/22]EJD05134.1 hypothetical protein FOMMEDRAFT_139681 [Fomitiporia mediterranea MF3/22]